MIPLALAVVILAPPDALLSVTTNPSSASNTVSPATLMVIVLEVSPAPNCNRPLGKKPSTKSAAMA